jgi:uroporphyrinogen-III synthase
MRLVVTRPQQDAEPLARQLVAAGHEVIMAPLLSIAPVGAPIPERDYQAVLITSANGARALEGRRELERLKKAMAIVVGPASAAAALGAGFARVEQADGDVASLARTAIASLGPKNGPLLHVSGAVTAGDLASTLAESGFEVDRVVAYEAHPAQALPGDCAAEMAAGKADGVTLYSPRTARIWVELVLAADLATRAAQMNHYCLSDNVAREVHEGLGAGVAVQVAPRPDEAALIEMIPAPA